LDEAEYRDFTTALGEAFCDVLWERCRVEASPQDGYEVFIRTLGADALTPERIHSMQVSKAQLIQLRDNARTGLAAEQISLEDMKEVVRTALGRWPPEAV
jgi:hypothetical protein